MKLSDVHFQDGDVEGSIQLALDEAGQRHIHMYHVTLHCIGNRYTSSGDLRHFMKLMYYN
jgi:hypothetical protein